ncbi:MAG TPA: hypothetical protein VHN14_16770 [Kofleriaceae bacterium]|nr:hypothetical protein [Kofleriaceae bacterium]
MKLIGREAVIDKLVYNSYYPEERVREVANELRKRRIRPISSTSISTIGSEIGSPPSIAHGLRTSSGR